MEDQVPSHEKHFGDDVLLAQWWSLLYIWVCHRCMAMRACRICVCCVKRWTCVHIHFWLFQLSLGSKGCIKIGFWRSYWQKSVGVFFFPHFLDYVFLWHSVFLHYIQNKYMSKFVGFELHSDCSKQNDLTITLSLSWYLINFIIYK